MRTTTKMNIDLKIKSVDYYGDVFIENVRANKKESNEYIEYNYSSEIGVCKIRLAKDKKNSDYFEMTRNGESLARLTFNNNGQGIFKLETNGLKKEFEIRNGKIDFSLKTVCFSYEIYEEKEIINTLIISLIEE
ncbi:MAG: hypothetical protein ACRC0S_07600 [Fusobacteriaceae bacterium]